MTIRDELLATEMIERVAKAMFERQGFTWKIDWIMLASVAIEAMREPTNGMLYEGCRMLGEEADWDSARLCWNAMIDTALGKPPK